MRKLAGEGLPVTLALSLHAPDDELRDTLVPVNTRWKVAEAIDAAFEYTQATGRRASIEYALIRDINDQAWRADLLGKLLNARGRGWVHVNPIPLNPTPGSKWTASDPAVERAFVAALEARGIPTTIRDTRGSEIDGACGQLAATVRDLTARRAAPRGPPAAVSVDPSGPLVAGRCSWRPAATRRGAHWADIDDPGGAHGHVRAGTRPEHRGPGGLLGRGSAGDHLDHPADGRA